MGLPGAGVAFGVDPDCVAFRGMIRSLPVKPLSARHKTHDEIALRQQLAFG